MHSSRPPLILCLHVCLTFLALLGIPAVARSAAMFPKAATTRVEQVSQQIYDTKIKIAPAADSALIGSPPLTAADRQLVRWCLVRYGLWGIPATEANSETQHNVERAAEKAARHFFGSMSRAEMAARLVPLRKALYRGTRAYAAVSFVLAYDDIDFTHNALRVVEAISLGGDPSPRLKAAFRSAGFKDQIWDEAGEEEVADAVSALYHRHQSAVLLQAYLRAPTDGHVTGDRLQTVAYLFLSFPADVLRASADRRDMQTLARCVDDSAGEDINDPYYTRVGRILRRLEHSHNVQTARLARRFQGVFQQQ